LLDFFISKKNSTMQNVQDNSNARTLFCPGFLEKLRYEKHLTKIHADAIENRWKDILRSKKIDELRMYAQEYISGHNQDMNRKDKIISMLYGSFEQAEEQSHVAFGAHTSSMERLIDLFDTQLISLEKSFEEELKILGDEFMSEREAFVCSHTIGIEDINENLATTQTRENDKEIGEITDHNQTLEEIKNKNVEALNGLRVSLDSKIEELEEQFELEHTNYIQRTDQKSVDYKLLSRKDEQIRCDIDIKTHKIKSLDHSLQRWKRKTSKACTENTAQNQVLYQKKRTTLGKVKTLKEKMGRFREVQKINLVDLTKCANDTKRRLQKDLDLATRIIKFSDLNKKKETELEEISLTFETNNLKSVEEQASRMLLVQKQECNPGNHDNINNNEHENQPDDACIEQNKWRRLDQFWKKYNQALLDNSIIEKECGQLTQENIRLQEKMKQFLDGITVNDFVIRKENPLLVINGRIKKTCNEELNYSEPSKNNCQSSPIVIDANHVFVAARKRQ